MTKTICIWLLGYYTVIGTDSIRASWGKIYRRHFLGQKESINFFFWLLQVEERSLVFDFCKGHVTLKNCRDQSRVEN